MTFANKIRTAWGRAHKTLGGQSGAFDLPSIMIGVAVVAILTVGVLAAIFGVIPWSQDKAAQQDLDAVHTAQGVAFAKDGGFKSGDGLVAKNLLPADLPEGLDIRASSDGRKYVGISTSATGNKFIISSEAPTPRPLTSQDKWLDGGTIDPGAPAAPAPEAGPEGNSAIHATHTCGPSELVITQAMQDHSDDNVGRKANGEALLPYPGGGWSIIVNAADLAPGATGALLTTEGEFAGYESLTNTSGPSIALITGDSCQLMRMVNGVIHSTTDPAQVVWDRSGGSISYVLDGKLHREDGPAVVMEQDGVVVSESYYYENQLHRVGGAAENESWSDGTKKKEAWYDHGALHRTDGAALVELRADGTQQTEEWRVDDVFHRTDGPADIWFEADGKVLLETYYINGKQTRTTEYHNGVAETDDWWLDGIRHREDGPAHIGYGSDGSTINVEKWYSEGSLHRVGAPAESYIRAGGIPSSESWYINGELHRGDGPAHTSYHDDGAPGGMRWYSGGKLHRLDGPAEQHLEADGTPMHGQTRFWIAGVAQQTKESWVNSGGDLSVWPSHLS